MSSAHLFARAGILLLAITLCLPIATVQGQACPKAFVPDGDGFAVAYSDGEKALPSTPPFPATAQATFVCDAGQGYNPGFPGTANCTAGDWKVIIPASPCEAKLCPKFTPGPGLILTADSLPADDSRHWPGNATFTCDTDNSWNPVNDAASPIATCIFSTATKTVTWVAPALKCTRIPLTGTVVAWGSDGTNETDVPSTLGATVKTISAGDSFSLALLSTNTIVGFGRNSSGQLTPPTLPSNITDISAGGSHALALAGNGAVIGWGANANGQAQSYTPANSTAPRAIAISAGYNHSLALLDNGTVIGWGLDTSKQASGLVLSRVIAIDAGGSHSLALVNDGTVYAAGDDSFGQATVPNITQTVIAISAGFQHSLALLVNGSVVAWGRNQANQTAVPDSLQINGTSRAIAISAGGTYSLALLDDYSVVSWGTLPGPVPASIQTRTLAISAGLSHVLALNATRCFNNCPPAGK